MEPSPTKSEQAKISQTAAKKRNWRGIGLVFLCFVAGALGSAVVLFAQGDFHKALNSNTTRQVVSSEGDLISEIAAELGPSTVSITTQSIGGDEFFGPEVQEGAGTGIVVSKDGYILTNKHVIPESTKSVNVVMSDGKEYTNVKVVGRDTLNDIAFLKISGVNNLTAAKIGSSADMKVGQKVVALGNALGQFQNTVTTGVISGKGRPLTAQDGQQTEQLENLFQTDAAINPGNSGGPLVNLEGEVIGVNTAIAQEAEGIGFAIPIDDVKGIIASVTEQGKIIRPYVGVRSVTLTPAIAAELGLNESKGAYILAENGVVAGGPAEKAGVKSGDIIVKVDGKEISQQSLGSVIAQHKVGDELTFTIKRGNDQLDVRVRLEKLPDNL